MLRSVSPDHPDEETTVALWNRGGGRMVVVDDRSASAGGRRHRPLAGTRLQRMALDGFDNVQN